MRRAIVATVAAIAGVAGTLFVARPAPAPTSRAVAPHGVRIRVQVLNATPTRGLARRATVFLRDRGFDVVDVATAPHARDSTLVLDRSGHPSWAELVARALGGARVESRPDSSRYLDVTVFVARDWTPPSEPFYP
ncbi:MAG: LytR C-terminal domain-containing protein [Gemmatimonadaceae bacterium]